MHTTAAHVPATASLPAIFAARLLTTRLTAFISNNAVTIVYPVRTAASQAVKTGSNPVGDAKRSNGVEIRSSARISSPLSFSAACPIPLRVAGSLPKTGAACILRAIPTSFPLLPCIVVQSCPCAIFRARALAAALLQCISGKAHTEASVGDITGISGELEKTDLVFDDVLVETFHGETFQARSPLDESVRSIKRKLSSSQGATVRQHRNQPIIHDRLHVIKNFTALQAGY